VEGDDTPSPAVKFIAAKGTQIQRLAAVILLDRGCTDPAGHVDEVGQDVRIKVLQKWESLLSPEDALNTITANTAGSHARICRRERAVEFLDDTVVPCFSLASAIYADPRKFYEDALFLKQVLAPLEPLDRKIIELHWFYGFKFFEIAAILGLPGGTVRSRHSRALAQLK
jgi:RNA polymerase sigma factor (sigma-70 family)